MITEFTKVSLDPRSSNEAAEESLRSTDATSGMRSVTDGLVVPMGKPRYVNGKVPIAQPKTSANREVLSPAVLTVMRVDF